MKETIVIRGIEYTSLDSLATQFGVHPVTFRRWHKAGLIPTMLSVARKHYLVQKEVEDVFLRDSAIQPILCSRCDLAQPSKCAQPEAEGVGITVRPFSWNKAND